MKKIKYIFLIIISLSLFTSESFSQIRQGSYITSLEYSTAFNSGRISDFLSNIGFAGGGFTMRSFIKKNLAAGFSIGYNVISKEETDGTIEFTNGAISGPQARYLNYLPIYLNISHFFVKDRRAKFAPYVQANVGTIRTWQRAQLGIFTADNDNWHFGLGPEVGFISSLGNSVGLIFNAKYNYALSSGTTFAGKEENSFSFFNVNLGLTYMR